MYIIASFHLVSVNWNKNKYSVMNAIIMLSTSDAIIKHKKKESNYLIKRRGRLKTSIKVVVLLRDQMQKEYGYEGNFIFFSLIN